MDERVADPGARGLGLGQSLLELLLVDEPLFDEEVSEPDLLRDFCSHRPAVSRGWTRCPTPESPTEYGRGPSAYKFSLKVHPPPGPKRGHRADPTVA
ncbi:hypothetical protein D3C83_56880 [compost metagenome]